MSASADIASFQMRATLNTFLICEEGRSFEVGVHLRWGALSDNYDILKRVNH